eukprot:746933-Hanusia_phi.AAC.2
MGGKVSGGEGVVKSAPKEVNGAKTHRGQQTESDSPNLPATIQQGQESRRQVMLNPLARNSPARRVLALPFLSLRFTQLASRAAGRQQRQQRVSCSSTHM